jgi:hypothetical protein
MRSATCLTRRSFVSGIIAAILVSARGPDPLSTDKLQLPLYPSRLHVPLSASDLAEAEALLKRWRHLGHSSHPAYQAEFVRSALPQVTDIWRTARDVR